MLAVVGRYSAQAGHNYVANGMAGRDGRPEPGMARRDRNSAHFTPGVKIWRVVRNP